jgi:Tfp pilus assembly protein PilV
VIRPLHHRTTRRGLSLVEVLLSLAILIIGLTAIGQLVNLGTDAGSEARAYARGNRLAQAKMAEVEAGVLPVSSPADGQFDGDDAAWTYSVMSEPTGPTNSTGQSTVYNVTVTVSSDVKGKPIQVVLVQMVFDPTLMGSSAQLERPPPDSSGSGTGSSTGTGTGSSSGSSSGSSTGKSSGTGTGTSSGTGSSTGKGGSSP